ncbi:MAG: HEPN domain-containing protein [Armatimonadetes bacterium]|nr:HEPN domain-containing protein [Armatimonadota bacterium]
MNEENKRRNLRQAMAEAQSIYEEAELLVRHGKFKGAVSRAYYSVLCGARALLLSLGVEARTHSGVAHLVYEHFVQTGRLEPATARVLRVLQVSREDADYELAAIVTGEMAAAALVDAGNYLTSVRQLLAADG